MTRQEQRRVNTRKRTVGYSLNTFEDGSAVRKLQALPEEVRKEPRRPKQEVSSQTRKNRARAMQMSRGYVVFLAAVCVAIVGMCVLYLQLQTQITTQTRQIAAMERELSDLKADNDAYYNTTIASLDLEAVKEAALTRLGMHYADESQIQYFTLSGSSYVRQYQEVPKAKQVDH